MIDARFKSIKSWPKKPTPATERRNRFRSSWQQTLDLIETELSKLKAGDIVIEAYFRPEDIRNDGWPRSNARPSQPGVVLKFATKKGQMEFACDKFKDYQQNLRAIGMGLEKLRMVEDYGIVTEAEQYTGWLKLPAASATDTEFRLTGRDSLCPSGASLVSTMPPSPLGVSKGPVAK